jgi:uncharacterized protein YdeI (YjbR/CyaY-like superfamily)
MEPIFFSSAADFRKWLDKHHTKEKEVLAGFYKTGSGKPSMTWSESVDQALCYGWIDGVRRSIDGERYCIRFTPRKENSNWSAINIKKITQLKKQGLMKPAGLSVFAKRKESRSRIYSYEKDPVTLAPEFEKAFKADEKAWTFFQKQPPSYRTPALNWVMSAKQEATRKRRFETLVNDSREGRRLKHLNTLKKPSE